MTKGDNYDGSEKYSEIAKETIKKLKDVIFKVIDDVKAVTTEEELSYEEAMRFFVKYKNTNKAIVKGVMLRETVGGGRISFTQAFLDKNNQVICTETGDPIGRKLTVVSLDSELMKTFKNSDLVIVN
ncbi:MAG: hypothetical protein LBB43_05115 [Spirochaetaceae bacterium]|nr:hypothetical protein [Spirochaetaceae bacterium]